MFIYKYSKSSVSQLTKSFSMSYVKVTTMAEELGKDFVHVSLLWSTLQTVNENRLQKLAWSIKRGENKTSATWNLKTFE